MTNSLKDRLADMDVEAWRANRETLEMEKSLMEEADKIRHFLDSGKSSRAESSTTATDDLSSYFGVGNDNSADSGTISDELEDLSKMFDD